MWLLYNLNLRNTKCNYFTFESVLKTTHAKRLSFQTSTFFYTVIHPFRRPYLLNSPLGGFLPQFISSWRKGRVGGEGGGGCALV